MKLQKKILSFSIMAAVLCSGCGCTANGTSKLETSVYEVVSERLPTAFSEYRIAQVSDFHNAEIGEGNAVLLDALREADADVILLTGDFVDSRRTDVDLALRFAKDAVELAPTYYVAGNHEMRIDEYGRLKDGLRAAGITVLENESVTLARGEETLRLVGLHDPASLGKVDAYVESAYIDTQLSRFTWGETYTVVLSHRPEFFENYVAAGADLVCAGHAHGGQVRLPGIGGVIAPGQGLFPKYDAGIYQQGRTSMLVSRGVGNSLFPIRVNNPPELVVVELTKG